MHRHPFEHARGHDATHTAGRLVLLVLALGAGVNYALVNPQHNYLLDFRAYYATGRALHIGVNPYDKEALHAAVALPGGQSVVGCGYPPPALALMYALAWLPYPAVQIPWCVLQWVLALAALALVCRAQGCPLGAPVSVLIGFALFASTSFAEVFRWGQIDLLVLALLAAAYLASARQRPTGAGIWIALAALVKFTPVLYLAILFVRREFRGLVAGVVCIIGLLAAGCAMLGTEACGTLPAMLIAYGDDLPTLLSPKNVSLRAFVYRALVAGTNRDGPSTPWLNLGPAAASAVTWALLGLMAAATLVWMLRQRHVISTADCVATGVPLALLASPVTWPHSGVQLLIPLAAVAVTALRAPRLGLVDGAWLVLIVLLCTLWPTERYGLSMPPWLTHLAWPLLTYAALLLWLFMVTRFVPLKRAAETA